MTYYYPHQKWLVYDGCAIEQLPSGGFKAIVYGSPAYHMMAWAGENIHKITIQGQPMRGFKTATDALDFVCNKFKSNDDAEQWCKAQKKAGTWHSGNSWYFIDLEKRSAVLYKTPPGTNLTKLEIFLK
jgi:hypothetical protein